MGAERFRVFISSPGDVAEEAVQDAFAIALERWPRDGMPPNPGACSTPSNLSRLGVAKRRHSARSGDVDARAAERDRGDWTGVTEHPRRSTR